MLWAGSSHELSRLSYTLKLNFLCSVQSLQGEKFFEISSQHFFENIFKVFDKYFSVIFET